MEEEHLNNRLIQLRKSLNMNQGQFAAHINISQGALSLLENQKTRLSLESLESIIYQTKVSPQWLLSGEGAMFESKDSKSQHTITIVKDHLIPLISLEAHAGYLAGDYEKEEYKNTLDYFKIPGFINSKYRLFQVEGESMKHILYPKDIVIAEKKDVNKLQDGELHIVNTAEELVAKRVYHEKNEGNLILRSENPEFTPYTLKKKDIVEIWLIRGKITKHLAGIDRIYGDRITSLENSLDQLKIQIQNLQKN